MMNPQLILIQTSAQHFHEFIEVDEVIAILKTITVQMDETRLRNQINELQTTNDRHINLILINSEIISYDVKTKKPTSSKSAVKSSTSVSRIEGISFEIALCSSALVRYLFQSQ